MRAVQSKTWQGVGLWLLCISCAGVADPSGEDGPTQESQQAVWDSSWVPTQWANQMVGVGNHPSFTFNQPTWTWYNDGTVCRGYGLADLCSHSSYEYSAPDNNFNAIRAVGIANNNSHVYAWYSNGTVSHGHSSNLTAYNTNGVPRTFYPPAKPGGGFFAMSALVEADNSPNGHWYYYWKSGSILYRTTGDSEHGDSHTLAKPVTVSTLHGGIDAIVGIAFVPGNPNTINTWYADGYVNMSTDSLNLAQP